MAFSRLVFSILLLSVSCYATKVPVFIWGDLVKTSAKANPFQTYTAPEFSDILKEEFSSDPFTVVYVDETLSVEDLSRKNAEGATSFPYLHSNLGKSWYIPSADSPVLAISNLAGPEQVDKVKLTEKGLTAEIESDTPKFMFIDLDDARDGESRAEMLRRHNDFMEDTFAKLKKDHEKVVAIYTAHNPSWVIPTTLSRTRRQTEASVNSEDFALDGLRLYSRRIEIREANSTINLNGIPVAVTEFNSTSQTMNSTLTYGDNSFILNFREKGGYWFFDSVTFSRGTANEEDLYPGQQLYALIGFSYSCGQNVIFSNVNATRTLVFENLQIQPYFNTTNGSQVFGDTFDCVGFFSAPIWSGLMVTFILLIITFIGIVMMMDIKTMDRFDDPKGKTITINAVE